jgi:cardiolipin synthase
MNLRNFLSLVRLALVPVFAGIFFTPGQDSHKWAALVYAIASLTDVLDGFIARRYHLTSRLGRILDPLADKLMAFTVLICISVAQIVPYWAVVIFFMKEAAMGIGSMTIYQKMDDIMPSDILGKSATAVFFAVCITLMLFRNIPEIAATLMISGALILTIAALFNYFRKYNRYLKLKKS